MSSTTEQAANEVAKATGTTFGNDTIGQILAKYDMDGNGTFDITEVRDIVHDVVKAQNKVGMLKKFVALLLVIIIVLLTAMFGVSMAAGAALKESHIKDDEMISTRGVAVRIDSVETSYKLWDMPSLSSYELGKLDFLECYIDMSSNPQVGEWTEASFKPAGMYKPTMDEMVIYTSAPGVSIVINRLQQTGTIQIGNVYYPISDKLPETARRRLFANVDDERPEPITEAVTERRRLGRRGGGSSVVSGHFKMPGGGNRAGAGRL